MDQFLAYGFYGLALIMSDHPRCSLVSLRLCGVVFYKNNWVMVSNNILIWNEWNEAKEWRE